MNRMQPILDHLDSFEAFVEWRNTVVTQKQMNCQGGCPLGSLSTQLSEIDPEARESLVHSFADWEAPIRNGIAAMRERGELRADANPDQLALAMLAALQGGPLLPVKNEYYQSGLGVEALEALASLAGFVGKEDVKKDLTAEFEKQKPALDKTFWLPESKSYAFAIDKNNKQVDEPSVLSTVPMWFGLPDSAHAEEMITRLAEAEHETDWGMRIISGRSSHYDGSGYHFGAVWPLFTGWASVGEYRYHRELPAYSNLRANALLGADGSLGHFAEVLSGDYYSGFSTSSPHQIWSAAMSVSPLLRGLFGLQTDALKHEITLAPHVPADWTMFSIRNVPLQTARVDFQYRKTANSIVLETTRTGAENCTVEFSPAFSLRTMLSGVFAGTSMP